MQVETYILGDTFHPVSSQHIDRRLISHICSNNLDIETITANINHILIYKDFIKNKKSTILHICSPNIYYDNFLLSTIYGTHTIPSYYISRIEVEIVLDNLPLKQHITNFLIDNFNFKCHVKYQKYQDTNLWSKIFVD